MKLFLSYLKIHWKTIVMFIAFGVVVSVVSYLYSLPSEAIIYSFMLCFIIELVSGIAGFFRFRKRHIAMEIIMNNITAGIEQLPEPRNILEKDYYGIIMAMNDERRSVLSHEDMTIRDINDYYTMWVHQIKTPISAMNLLLQKNPDDDLSEQLFKINSYVEMVLTYIRCGNDASDLVLKKSNLDAIIKSSVRKYAKLFIRKKISLNYDGTNMTVLTDEKWLGFVIEQILSNSLKYTFKGNITIKTEDNRTLIIEDTGIGIAAEDLPRICEKGYTGYNGREDTKSTGIGLFLSKKVLDSLGHKLKITSEPGKGTKVMITFENISTRYE